MATIFPLSASVGQVYNGYEFDGTSWNIIGLDLTQDYVTQQEFNNSAVTVSGFQTVTNKTISSPVLISPEEKVTVSSSSISGAINFDCLSQGVIYYTSNAAGNWTVNFRGDSSNTMNSILDIGQSFTANILSTQGSTAYYPTAFNIDSSSITPKWQYGSAPTSGNPNSIDIYNFSIIKIADASFSVFGTFAKFS